MDIKTIDNKYIAKTYGRVPLTLVSGKGALVYDENGKEYIDLGSGIAVNTFGYADASWVEAVSKQASMLQHASNYYYTEPCTALARLLCEKTGMKKVFFSNSGAEANECAIKAARKYAADKKGTDYYKIITLKNSFHGRTITTLAATGQDVFHKDFLPLTEGFLYSEANNIEALRALLEDNKVAAIMFELVQGEGGVNPLEQSFVDEMVKIAAQKDILLIADEVQTGNGRCGSLYAYMNYGFVPDILTTAKGLGGGLPIGATLFGEKVKDVYQPGMHGSTFGGNPVSCAGALTIIERLDEDFLSQVREKSDYIFSSLSACEGIKSLSGAGLMIGIETMAPAGEIMAAAREEGVLVLTAKTKVRLLPPLNIGFEELKKAISVLIKVCKERA